MIQNFDAGFQIEGNEMTRSVGGECIGLYEKQLWKDRESLEEDWENVKEQMISLLKEEWIEINKSKKWIEEAVKNEGYCLEEVFYGFYRNNHMYLIKSQNIK